MNLENKIHLQTIDPETLRVALEKIFSNQKSEVGIEDLPEKLLAFAVFDQDKIVGGILAKQSYESIYINLLAVDPAYREQRVGSRLMKKIEELAIIQGTIQITLTTMSYQALGFYQKQGYVVFGSLEDMPMRGVTKYYLHKRLKA